MYFYLSLAQTINIVKGAEFVF